MNLLIIGATRGIGFQLLEQALQAEHVITALVRDPQKMPKQHDRLRVVQGDILDLERVQRAMAEQEAVCVTIGIGITWKPVTVFSQGTRNVLEAMRRQGVRRLICITGIGAGDSKGHGGFVAGPGRLRHACADSCLDSLADSDLLLRGSPGVQPQGYA
jgi:putative NADH-flavin reductase